jgi:hypothetical protein
MPKFTDRMLLIVPAARRDAFNAFMKASVDKVGGLNTLTVGLSPTGNAPPTHYCCNGSFSHSQLKALLGDMAGTGTGGLPANWDAQTRGQKKTWIAANAVVIQGRTGIRLAHADSDGTWPNAEAVIAAAGLKRIEGP